MGFFNRQDHLYDAIQIVNKNIITVNRKVNDIMATLQERFDKVDSDLSEASAELSAELDALRDALASASVTLPPEAEQSLSNVEAKAAALAGIVPNAPPAEPEVSESAQ